VLVRRVARGVAGTAADVPKCIAARVNVECCLARASRPRHATSAAAVEGLPEVEVSWRGFSCSRDDTNLDIDGLPHRSPSTAHAQPLFETLGAAGQRVRRAKDKEPEDVTPI
jgi:hypothetical protein